MNLHIEQLAARPDLLPTVAAWIYHEWWTAVPGATCDSVVGLFRDHLTHDRIPLTLVALAEGAPVGTATLLHHDVGTEQWAAFSPWLAAVYVAPEHRNRGVGTRLIDAAAAKATELEVEILYLLTAGRESLYARSGWEVVDRRGEEAVMARRLAR